MIFFLKKQSEIFRKSTCFLKYISISFNILYPSFIEKSRILVAFQQQENVKLHQKMHGFSTISKIKTGKKFATGLKNGQQ